MRESLSQKNALEADLCRLHVGHCLTPDMESSSVIRCRLCQQKPTTRACSKSTKASRNYSALRQHGSEPHSENPGNHKCTEHIDIKHLYARAL